MILWMNIAGAGDGWIVFTNAGPLWVAWMKWTNKHYEQYVLALEL